MVIKVKKAIRLVTSSLRYPAADMADHSLHHSLHNHQTLFFTQILFDELKIFVIIL